MLSSCYFVAFLLCITFTSFTKAQTTPHLEDVFRGKCFNKNPSGVDCIGLFNNFSYAATMNNYKVNDTYYNPFFSMADFSTPESSILFWSGNKSFALAISSNDIRYVTVEETSTGYVLNNLSWCGTANNTFDYVNPCGYSLNPTTGYYGMEGIWNRASTMFARGARGNISVLLQPQPLPYNPNVLQAFRNNSIFYRFELPNMNTTLVKSITLLILRNKTFAPDERCGSGSVLDLANRIKAQFNFTPSCIDDPQQVYARFCPDHTIVSGACLAATLVYHYELQNSRSHMYLLWAIITTVSTGVLLILAIVLLVRGQNKKNGYEKVKELDPTFRVTLSK